MEMEFEDGKNVELTPEQMEQVAGGKVGDVFTGWACWKCNSNMTTAKVLSEKTKKNYQLGRLYRRVRYEHHCDACGDTWYSASTQNLGPAPEDWTDN